MSKKQIRRIKQIIVLWALLWLIRSLFFLKKEVSSAWVSDLLQWLINVIDGNQPTSAIFWGDTMTENIYKKTLKWQKRKTANTTNIAMEKIQFINNWADIEKKDLVNVLYNSNSNVYAGITFLCKECKVTDQEINNSYKIIITELQKIGVLTTTNDNAITRSKVDNRVNSQFIIASENEISLQKFNEATLWEDLFINGVADDSDYDLQVDMQNIWDLLFESFIAPIETVFYKLPPNYAWWNTSNNWWNTNTNERQELINLLQNTLTPSWTINEWVITNWWSQPTQTNSSNPSNINSSNTNQPTNDTTITDTSLQDFVEKNTLSQKATTQLAWIQWNICVEWINAWPISTTPEKEEIIDPIVLEEYLSEIQEQVDNYNNIYPEDQIIPNIKDNPAFDDMNPEQTNQFIKEYINDLFNVESTESCLKDCDSLPVSERLICQIQCLCFTMSRPNDPDIRVKSMNEMLKLRFCMVPAASMAIPKGKNIYSLDDILTRIQANMDNVVNWWEMVKFQKTKEFLDNPIADFSFSKLISFQINLNMKPIFNNKSEIAKKEQQNTYIQKLEKANGKEQTLWTDTNKYIVVQDTAKNKIYKEYAWSVEEYQKNYNEQKLKEEVNSRKNTATDEENKIIIENKSKNLTIIVDFLSQNLKFREQTEKELNNLNSIIFSLQSKL